jgi:hypothetical protein
MKWRPKQIKEIPCLLAEPSADLSHLTFDSRYFFAQETVDGLERLGVVLQEIRNRLLCEGYSIIDGKLYSSNGKLLYERFSTHKK